jgi:serine/threonine protein phosphatase 1
MKTFVMGDIHGNIDALKQCLERSSFNYEEDKLIILGDVVDGFIPTIKECVDELLKIKNKIFIIGNHDMFFIDYIEQNLVCNGWYHQGGYNTLKSYGLKQEYLHNRKWLDDYEEEQYNVEKGQVEIPQEHIDFFKNSVYYYIDENNNLFVHGGAKYNIPIEEQDSHYLTWDRDLFKTAKSIDTNNKVTNNTEKIPLYNEIFIGHTSTKSLNSDVPLNYCNLWMLDTGAGYEGKLTIMNVDTKEYWQSDKVKIND